MFCLETPLVSFFLKGYMINFSPKCKNIDFKIFFIKIEMMYVIYCIKYIKRISFLIPKTQKLIFDDTFVWFHQKKLQRTRWKSIIKPFVFLSIYIFIWAWFDLWKNVFPHNRHAVNSWCENKLCITRRKIAFKNSAKYSTRHFFLIIKFLFDFEALLFV